MYASSSQSQQQLNESKNAATQWELCWVFSSSDNKDGQFCHLADKLAEFKANDIDDIEIQERRNHFKIRLGK